MLDNFHAVIVNRIMRTGPIPAQTSNLSQQHTFPQCQQGLMRQHQNHKYHAPRTMKKLMKLLLHQSQQQRLLLKTGIARPFDKQFLIEPHRFSLEQAVKQLELY